MSLSDDMILHQRILARMLRVGRGYARGTFARSNIAREIRYLRGLWTMRATAYFME